MCFFPLHIPLKVVIVIIQESNCNSVQCNQFVLINFNNLVFMYCIILSVGFYRSGKELTNMNKYADLKLKGSKY